MNKIYPNCSYNISYLDTENGFVDIWYKNEPKKVAKIIKNEAGDNCIKICGRLMVLEVLTQRF